MFTLLVLIQACFSEKLVRTYVTLERTFALVFAHVQHQWTPLCERLAALGARVRTCAGVCACVYNERFPRGECFTALLALQRTFTAVQVHVVAQTTLGS